MDASLPSTVAVSVSPPTADSLQPRWPVVMTDPEAGRGARTQGALLLRGLWQVKGRV